MKLAIHKSNLGFHPRCVAYCEANSINYKIVDCYVNDLIQEKRKDFIAKQILFALEYKGFKVFPDFKTTWHFDDKVAQKDLFEQLGFPCANSYVFYDKSEALKWPAGEFKSSNSIFNN